MPRSTTRAVARLARALGGFGGSVLVTGLVSVAVVPVVITSTRPTAWAGIAVAQAIASFVAVFVGFGWGVTGPATVAGLAPAERGAYFRGSVASRAWLACLGFPLCAVLVVLLAPGDRIADVLAAFALLTPALGASWFFVGEQSPFRLLWFDAVPRALGTVVGAILLVAASAPLAVFTGFQAAGGVAAVVIGWLSVLRRHPGRTRLRIRDDLRRLGSQSSGVTTAGTAALYVNLPVVLAGALLPGAAVASYAVADKLQKLALTAIGPVFQVTQGLVGAAPAAERTGRARRVARAALALGGLTAVGFAALGMLGVRVLSGGHLAAPFVVVASLGIALGAIAVTAIVGLSCLTALGAVRQVAVSTVLGAVVGVPLICLGAVGFGIEGIAVAVAVSEVLVACYQLVALRRLIARSVTTQPASPGLDSRPIATEPALAERNVRA